MGPLAPAAHNRLTSSPGRQSRTVPRTRDANDPIATADGAGKHNSRGENVDSQTVPCAGDRFERWRQAVANTFVPLRCDPTADFAPFNFSGRIRTLQLGAVQVSEVTATPLLVERTAPLISRTDGDFFKVNLQLTGSCLLTQDGREAPLRPGDFAIYDTTRPYAMRLGRAYR